MATHLCSGADNVEGFVGIKGRVATDVKVGTNEVALGAGAGVLGFRGGGAGAGVEATGACYYETANSLIFKLS